MTHFESPTHFRVKRECDDRTVEYSRLMEVAQGGPEVGLLSIGGKLVSPQYRFGGPPLCHERFLYVPIFSRELLSSGFQPCRINMATLQIEVLGKRRNRIHLDRLEGGRLYFFSDLSGTAEESIPI